MTLLIFCMAMLSIIFMTVFGFWWDDNSSFTIHLSALVMVVVTIISIVSLISIYPLVKPRFVSNTKRSTHANIAWGSDVSSKLSSPAAVLDGHSIVFANNMFLSELGLSEMKERIIDMPITNLIHPSDHVNLAKVIAALSDDHVKNETMTLRMLYADGTSIPVHISISPLTKNDKSKLNLLQFTSTSHHKAAVSNPEKQIDYHLIVDRIEQIVFQLNVQQELIFLNPSWEKILDYSQQESLNQALLSFIHPEDILVVEAHLSNLSQGKRNNCHFQTRLIAKNGASYWMEMIINTTSALKGERTGIIGTFTDISAMKQAELSSKANRPSPLGMIHTNIPAMIYRCKNDRNWSFEFASDGSHEVTGYQSYEIANSPNLSYMQLIHPDDQAHAWEYIQKQILKEQKFQLIYRIITRSGKVKWILEQGEGVYSSTGELLSLEGIISEVAYSHDRINPALLQLQKFLASEDA